MSATDSSRKMVWRSSSGSFSRSPKEGKVRQVAEVDGGWRLRGILAFKVSWSINLSVQVVSRVKNWRSGWENLARSNVVLISKGLASPA